ncbi:MAG: hypothetical protein M1343_08455 [Chloroflexi bacterium]|nr:hypothetical protein [Chloroflexota bacterium]
MIYGLREYVVNQTITRLGQMLTGFVPAVQLAGQHSLVKLTYPNVYVVAKLPSFSSSVLGDFWGDEQQPDGTWQESYSVKVPNLSVLLNVSAKNEIERNKVTDKIVNTILLGKNATDVLWRDVLYADGLQLKTVSLAAESEENTPQEGKIFHAQLALSVDTEFKATITDQAVSLVTLTGNVVVTTTI